MPEDISVIGNDKVITHDKIPAFFCRHSSGLDVYESVESTPLFEIQEETLHAAWSPSGTQLLINDTTGGLVVHQISSNKVACNGVPDLTLLKFDTSPSVSARGIRQLQWSPRGSYVVAFWQYDQKALAAGLDDRNVAVWSTANVPIRHGESVDIRPSAGFVLRGVAMGQWPVLRWREDEEFCVLASRTELTIYDGHNVGGIPLLRIHVAGVVSTAIAPLEQNSHMDSLHIAAFSPISNGHEAEFKVFHALNLRKSQEAAWSSSAVSTLGFADSAEMAWSPSGASVLVLANTTVDSAGENYGGIGDVYLAQRDGSRLEKVNKLVAQEASWSPTRDEFIIIEGKSPSQIILYNQNREILFTFPPAYRNTIRWDPTGTMIALGGFGSLAGDLTFWYRGEEPQHVEPIAAWRESCTVLCGWAPGSGYFFTASTFPRMRVDNLFKIFDFEGQLVTERRFGQLLDFQWKPNPDGSCIPLKKPTQQPSGASVLANPRSGRELVVDPQKVEAERRRQMAHRGRKEPNFTKGGIPTVATAAQAARMEKNRQLDAISDWRAAPRETDTKTEDSNQKRRTSSVKTDDTGTPQPPITPPPLTPSSEEDKYDSRGTTPLSGSPRDRVEAKLDSSAGTTASIPGAVEPALEVPREDIMVNEERMLVTGSKDLSVEDGGGSQQWRPERSRHPDLPLSRTPGIDIPTPSFGALESGAAHSRSDEPSAAPSQRAVPQRPAPQIPSAPPPQHHEFTSHQTVKAREQKVPTQREALSANIPSSQFPPGQLHAQAGRPALDSPSSAPLHVPVAEPPPEHSYARFVSPVMPYPSMVEASSIPRPPASAKVQGSELDRFDVTPDLVPTTGETDGNGLVGLLRRILPPSASVHVAAQSTQHIPAPPSSVPLSDGFRCSVPPLPSGLIPTPRSFRTDAISDGSGTAPPPASARTPDMSVRPAEELQGFFDLLFRNRAQSRQKFQDISAVAPACQKYPTPGCNDGATQQATMAHTFQAGTRNVGEIYSGRAPQVQSGASAPFSSFAPAWSGEPSSARAPVVSRTSDKRTDIGGRPHPLKHKCWEYLDPQGIIRGPFNYADMQKWYSLGYFEHSLPIRCAPGDQFVPLVHLFSQGKPFGIDLGSESRAS